MFFYKENRMDSLINSEETLPNEIDKEEKQDDTILFTMNYLLSKSVLEKITQNNKQDEIDLFTYREKIEQMIQELFDLNSKQENIKIDEKCKQMFLDFVSTCNEYFTECDKWNSL